jgi:hypothetical protein
MTWAQILIGKPQAYEETCSQRGKPKQDGEPKNDWILAPTYLNAVSIDEFSECQGYGSAPRREARESTKEQRGKSS